MINKTEGTLENNS